MKSVMKTELPESRPWLEGMTPYVPGEPTVNLSGALASNENPFGPSPSVGELFQHGLPPVNRYPDALSTKLVRRIAETYEIDEKNILVGNGSDELIQLLVTAYAAYGGTVVCADPPYQLHEKIPKLLGGRVVKVPLNDWCHDLQALSEVNADLAFICNPHNPTGTMVDRTDILRFVDKSGAALTVIDEAYIEYAEDYENQTLIRDAADGKVAVLRTFSKFFGLAGLRAGYLVAHEEIIDLLKSIRLPFGVNAVAQEAADLALQDKGYSQRVWDWNRSARQEMAEMFQKNGYTVLPSEANFILVLTEHPDALTSKLGQVGINVRLGRSLGFDKSVRVSIPNEEGLEMLKRIF